MGLAILACAAQLIIALILFTRNLSVGVKISVLYALISQCMLVWVVYTSREPEDFAYDRVWYTAMPMDGLEESLPITSGIMTAVAFLGVLPLILRPSKYLNNRTNPFEGFFGGLNNSKVTAFFLPALAMGFSLVVLYHALRVDWGVLWYNDDYLFAESPENIGLGNAVGRIAHGLLRLIGLASAGLVVFSLRERRYFATLLFAFCFSYALMILLGRSSRWSVALVGGLTFCVYAFPFRFSRPIALLGAIFTIVVFTSSIVGRGTKEYGVSQIPKNLMAIVVVPPEYIASGTLINLFEGGLNLANCVAFEPKFDMEYMYKSFLPTLSAIDGFEDIRDTMRFKYAEYIPMGGWGEAYCFGLFFFALYFIAYALMLLSSQWIHLNGFSLENSIFSILTALICVQSFNYSIRTTFRLILFLSCYVLLRIVLQTKLRRT